MENLCNLEKFRIFLNKESEEFNELIKSGNEDFILNLFCALKEENINKIVNFIKNDELNGNGYILNNLLQLEPVSLPIIDRFINSKFLDRDKDKDDFIKRVDMVRKISSHILETLTAEKIKIRNDERLNIKNSSYLLQQVMNEMEKHSEQLENLKEKQRQEKNLKSLKAQILEIEKELEVKNIEEMEEKLRYYENKKKVIDKIEEEIDESKKMFIFLPKDRA